MSRWLPAAGILLAALVLSSCQKSTRPAAPPPPAPLPSPTVPAAAGPVAGPAAAAPARPAAPSPAAAAAAGKKPATSAAVPARPGTGPAGISLQPQPGAQPAKGLASAGMLMALGRDSRILPEDFKIGPMGDALAREKDQDQAMEAAGKFLTGLVGGKVDKDLITEGSRDTMAGTLGFGLGNGNTPTSWRLGTPRTRGDGEVTAAVRLFRDDSSSEGEIYVARSGSKWLVSDLQLSLAQLSVKSDKPKEKFFPLDYRWLLEE